MSKVIFLLTFLLIIGQSVNAQLELRLTSDTARATSEFVDIDVLVSNFTNIVSMQFSLNWNPEVFNFSSIENVTSALDQFSEAGNIGTPPGAAVVKDGELTVSWSLTSTEPRTLPNNTRLFTLRLFAAGANCSSTEIMFANRPLTTEVVNAGFDLLQVNGISGVARIDNGNCGGGGNENGVGIIIEDVSASQGTELCVPVIVRDFTDIGSIQGSLRWDPSILRFTRLAPKGLPGVAANSMSAENGALSFVWFLENNGVSLADNASVFDICFDVIGNTGSSTNIEIVNQPVPVEVANESGVSLPFFVRSGRVTVGSGGGQEIGVGFIAGNLFTGSDTSICVPITTKNFTGIAAFQLGVGFDASILRYREIRSRGVNNVEAGATNAANGELRVLWTTDNNTPFVTLADDAVMFELCFSVVGSVGQRSPIGFINLGGFPIEVSTESGLPTDFFVRDGSVTIGEDPAANQVELRSSNTRVRSGDTTCVDITVRNFNNINGLGFTIEWNQAVLRHVRQQNFNLPNLTGGSSNFNLVNAGQLRLVWTPTAGQSVPDGTSIFQVCYEALAACDSGQSTMIAFVGSNGGNVEVIGGQSQPLIPTLVTGTVIIDSCSADRNINLITITNTTCDGDRDGAVAVDFTGMVGAVMCRWTDESNSEVSTSCNLVGVAGGTYTLRVTDEDSVVTTRSFTVVSPDPINITAQVMGMNCLGGGSISLTATGGSGMGYTYAWSGGLPAQANVTNLSGGSYTVTVSDSEGCTDGGSYTISDAADMIILDSVEAIACPDDVNTGTLQLNVSGGEAPYTFMTSNGNISSGGRLTGLTNINNLTVIVTDNIGCQMTFNNIDVPCSTLPTDECIGRSIISPNGDGMNDVFEIGCLGRGQNRPNQIEIYDRWGKLVYQASNYNNDWGGTDLSGAPLNEGGYMWVLQTGSAGNRDLFRGTVTILR